MIFFNIGGSGALLGTGTNGWDFFYVKQSIEKFKKKYQIRALRLPYTYRKI
jgi:hypothetical protein